MPYNTYINPTVRRNLFKEMKRMEDRTGVDSKQDTWRGVVAVLNQHNNLMDMNNSYAEEGAKISEYYREHGGEELKDAWNRESDKMVFTDTPDPLENFIDRHFKVITAVILFTFVGLSWVIGA